MLLFFLGAESPKNPITLIVSHKGLTAPRSKCLIYFYGRKSGTEESKPEQFVLVEFYISIKTKTVSMMMREVTLTWPAVVCSGYTSSVGLTSCRITQIGPIGLSGV